MANQKATLALGTERIPKLLIEYAIPSIIAMTASVIYNIVDSIFIGQAVGALALTALGVAMPLMNIMAAFGSLVGVGAASIISIKLGQKDKEGAKATASNALMLNIILGIGVAIPCLIFVDPLLYFFGASDDTIVYAREFISIQLYGNIFAHAYLGLNNILRATGFPRKSMFIIVTAVVTNALLDALFILQFGWGVRGAALATVIAQVFAFGLELTHFLNTKNEIHIIGSLMKLRGKIVKGIISIGLSPFLMNIVASMVVILINNTLQTHGGDFYIGAYTVVNRISLVFIMMVFGLNQAMQPIVGYNFGAKKYDRVTQTYRIVVILGVCVTTVGFILTQFFPETITRMFNSEQALVEPTVRAMRIAMAAYPLVGFQVVTANFFQSIGMAKNAIFLSLTRQLIFLVPLLLILPPIWGTDGVWASMPIADASASILTAILIIRQFRKFKKHPTEIEQPA